MIYEVFKTSIYLSYLDIFLKYHFFGGFVLKLASGPMLLHETCKLVIASSTPHFHNLMPSPVYRVLKPCHIPVSG